MIRWATGAADPRCGLIVVLGRVGGGERLSAESAGRLPGSRQTVLLVPMDSEGVEVPIWIPPKK